LAQYDERNPKISISEMRKNIAFIFGDIWREDKLLILLLALDTVGGVVLPFFGIYLPKLVVDLLANHADPSTVLLQLGGFTLGMAATYFLCKFASGQLYFHINDLRFPIYGTKIYLRTLNCEYSELESSEGQKRKEKAMNCIRFGDWSATTRLVNGVKGLVVALLGFVLYAGILASLHPLIILALALTSLATYLAMRWAINYQRTKRTEDAEINEKLNYIADKFANFEYGKDIRLYDAVGLYKRHREDLVDRYLKMNRKITNRLYVTNVTNAAVTFFRDGLAYAYLIWQVLNGHMTLDFFVFYFAAIAGFSDWLTSLLIQFADVTGTQSQISDMRSYLQQDIPVNAKRTEHLKVNGAPSIIFENVSFAYEAGKPILDHFSLDIAAGEKIALVGVNGAGKTTLVKLLCGFYEPDAGRILINGIDISTVIREDLFALFSPVFQDIFQLNLSLRENVSLRHPDETDEERIRESLKMAGIWTDIIKMPHGLDTELLRDFDDEGVMLSGGQQQKLLLARALYKNAPVLILDEPTAALDPIAEDNLYQQYNHLAASKTSIYISHRLASTRFCDRVVYLNNAIAEEIGTHEELMKNGESYAHMFEIQSHYYKSGDLEEMEAAL
jgi:ABC-type multidrug transport system fused ATPase/permease subunit